MLRPRPHPCTPLPLLALVLGCAQPQPAPVCPTPTSVEAEASAPPATAVTATPSPPVAPVAASGALDPSRGVEVGLVVEAFLSPHQEPDEEEQTPATTPKVFRSTAPSKSRAEREAAGHRGHGRIRFSKDLSRAFVDVRIEGVRPETINMFHIHCGKPGILGPILVDLAHAADLQKDLADGELTVELRNEHIVKTASHSHCLVAAFTSGCVIPSPSLGSVKPTKASTIAGMAQIARKGELYFNLHTTVQTYFGDIRGQLLAVDTP